MLALGPVVGNIAPIVTLIGGVVGLLSLPQPPKAAGISNDNAAPSMVTFCEALVVRGWVLWVMPCQIGSARDLLERYLTTVRQTPAENACSSQVARVVFRGPAQRFRIASAITAATDLTRGADG